MKRNLIEKYLDQNQASNGTASNNNDGGGYGTVQIQKTNEEDLSEYAVLIP